MIHQNKYTFSFTGASAMITETLIIAEAFLILNDWYIVLKNLTDSNSLNKIKHVTFKREFSEIKKRISLLTNEQLQILVNGSSDDSKAIILLSIVKSYTFIYEFISEVILNKYLLFDRSLTDADYIKFVNNKMLSHPELENITESTQKKVKQVVFKILEQVNLITNTKNGIIIKPILNKDVLASIISDNPTFLTAFLCSSEEIKIINSNGQF